MTYITGETIKTLREQKKLTQKQLADRLAVSDKTVSKWETDRGLPDIGILPELATALSVSVAELLTGDVAQNRNVAANLKKSRFYVCPICGNIVHATGEGAFSCCGIRLPAQEAELPDSEHDVCVEDADGEVYVQANHAMEKGHYISFMAYVTDNHIQLEKLYPEQSPACRFRRAGHGKLLWFCNKHGLFGKTI